MSKIKPGLYKYVRHSLFANSVKLEVGSVLQVTDVDVPKNRVIFDAPEEGLQDIQTGMDNFQYISEPIRLRNHNDGKQSSIKDPWSVPVYFPEYRSRIVVSNIPLIDESAIADPTAMSAARTGNDFIIGQYHFSYSEEAHANGWWCNVPGKSGQCFVTIYEGDIML